MTVIVLHSHVVVTYVLIDPADAEVVDGLVEVFNEGLTDVVMERVADNFEEEPADVEDAPARLEEFAETMLAKATLALSLMEFGMLDFK